MISRRAISIVLLIAAGLLVGKQILNYRTSIPKQVAIAAPPAPVIETPKPTVPDQPAPAPEVAPAPAPIAAPEPGVAPAEPAAKSAPGRTLRNARRDPVTVTSTDPVVPPDVARQALNLVGADPEAEVVWVSAINDPNMPSEVRHDLIEDLNEQGFDDPKHLTPDDLPLIESRLAIIEEIGDDAMDDVNAAAFAEAYKDLVNMHNKVMGQ